MGTRLLILFNSFPGSSRFLYLRPAAKYNNSFLPPPFPPTESLLCPTQNNIQMQAKGCKLLKVEISLTIKVEILK